MNSNLQKDGQYMAESNELLEMILRECQVAGDQPWYPADYAQATGVARSRLDTSLDELRLGGLVRLTEWVSGKGQGYALTDAGREVLLRPRLLSQVRHRGAAAIPPRKESEAPDRTAPGPRDWDRGKALHDALSAPRRPIVTQIILAASVLNFAVGLVMAMQAGATAGEFLSWSSQDPKVYNAHYKTGALEGKSSLVRGDWWRLITYCFVHSGGAIHLLMNMWVLLSLGPMLEKVWGHAAFALLYLVSGVGGAVAAVYFNPAGGIAGASGAICGLIASLVAWVWLNREYLRNSGEMLRNLLTNVVLIVVISLMPGVSGSGHFGGGVAGLLLTVPMNFFFFGKGEQRWLGLAGAVVVVAFVAGAAAYVSNPSELQHARLTYLPKIWKTHELAWDAKKEFVLPFVKQLIASKKVSQEQRKETLDAISLIQPELTEMEEKLAQAQTYKDDRINAALVIGQEYFRKWQSYFQSIRKLTDDQGNLIPSEIPRLNSLEKSLDDVQHQLLKESVLAK